MLSRYGFEISYLISTMLMMYTIYLFLDSFFSYEERKVSHIWVYYACYYVCITSIYLVFHIPALTMSVNGVAIFFISTRYTDSLKKAFMAVVYTYIIMVLVEGIVGYLILPQYGAIDMLAKYKINDSVAVITINLVQYVLVMIIVHFIDFKAQDLSVGYLVSLLILPAVSIYIMIVIFQAELNKDYHYVLVSLLLLIANFLVYFLYGVISRYLEMQHREVILMQQNDMYARQYELMQRSEEAMRGFRHDHNHHMAVLKGIADNGCSEEMKTYLGRLSVGGILKEEVIGTGNLVIDSIVNYHLTGLEREGVSVECHASPLPVKMSVEDFDMTSILSNLLANAVEGVRGAENKELSLIMRYDKGIFFIKVVNSFDGIVRQSKDRYLSLKSGKGHGIGISNVRRALEKYDGQLRVHHEEQWFEAEAMMYLKVD